MRSDFALGTLAAPLSGDAEFAAPALQSAGFDGIFLAPSNDLSATQRTKELIEATGLQPFGFASGGAPEPLFLSETAIFGITDSGAAGWGDLADAGYVKSCIDAAPNSLVFLHLTRASRGPTADANLERLRRTTVVSVGGRNPGFPDGHLAPGVFHDARRTRQGRPGLVCDIAQSVRRVSTQSTGVGATTRFAEKIAERALLLSLNLSRRAGLDSSLFRAPRI